MDWADLLKAHGPVLIRTAYRVLGRLDEAEDCVQDVLLEMLKRSPIPVRNWPAMLRSFVIRRALDRLRSRKAYREVGVEILDHVPAKPKPSEDSVSEAEMLQWLRTAVSELPPRQGEVFAMRHYASLTYTEIAATLEIGVGAVGALLHDARQQLQATLPPVWRTP